MSFFSFSLFILSTLEMINPIYSLIIPAIICPSATALYLCLLANLVFIQAF